MKPSDTVLEINHLQTYFYTDKGVVPAVDDISISVKKGKIIGIVGESGCGKSMTSLSIMQLIASPGKIAGGEILFQNKNLVGLSKSEMRSLRGNEISMIFQEPMTSLNPVYPVGKQVAETLLLHNKTMQKEEAKQKVIDMFKMVGIPEPERRYRAFPHQLSGGLRQRVMIAMALICRPKLLIADEPTTALDVTIEAQILKLMKQLQEEIDTSIIMITHNLGIVAEMCDYVYVMYAGKVMEHADVFELFDHPKHPYTEGLLKSIPRGNVQQNKKKGLYSIEGMVPNMLNLPKGCRFHPRCMYAEDACREIEPDLVDTGDGHMVRCIKYK
ncbi:ABC transporter ATP-binding protein [Brevibacillus fluminis]|uniref:ABC transporter ATP-binding protein n=1 Tax=Brevibacillus fluminis TaxID=511487 RepID=A0A3M8DHK9_9BACL|nr:ABC transporter ATP-binding protein [Brevibacillus fluminis]RNB86961.1 ABC transporter ATP-binding protein [Brevibacillus fluminis]